MNLVATSYELEHDGDRIAVTVDPTLGKAIRVGDIELFQAFLGNKNGNGGGVTARPSKRASGGGGGANAAVHQGRASEWAFTDAQRKQLTTAIDNTSGTLTDIERRILTARFMGSGSPNTTQLAKELGLKHSSEVTMLTRSGLRHAGIRVARLRKPKRSKR